MGVEALLWVSDADNTLWDTDSVYRLAHLALLSRVELELGLRADTKDRLHYLREVDQGLATLDHRGLRYPPAMLISATASRLTGVSLERALQDGVRRKSNLG